MSHPTLFDVPAGRVRKADPSTSVRAARAQRGGAELAIAAMFEARGPMTDNELCARLSDWHPPTIVSARSRLFKRGALETTGETRPTGRNGRDQQVWKLASNGGNK